MHQSLIAHSDFDERPNRRLGSVLVARRAFVGGLCLVAMAGCRGRAQEDMYRQKLQREVRVLEDQLYEADYENRVLIDKLRRERARDLESADTKTNVRRGRLRDDSPGASGSSGDFGGTDNASELGQGDLGQGDLGQDFDDVPADDAFRSRDDAQSPLRDPKNKKRSGKTDPSKSDVKQSVPSIPTPRPDPKASDPGASDPSDADDLMDIDSLIDPGTLVDPGSMVDPGSVVDPGDMSDPGGTIKPGKSVEEIGPGQLLDPGQFQLPPGGRTGDGASGDSSTPPGQMTIPDLLPAPGGPVPPGTNDLRINPIEPGTPAPPNAPNGRPDGPPGKIDFPFSTNALGGLGPIAGVTPKIKLSPKKIRIDATSSQLRLKTPSTAANQDAVIVEGVDLVVRADDPYGHPIPILGQSHDPVQKLQPDTVAKTRPLPSPDTYLSVIALDPSKSGDDAKLGRWDFDTAQLQELETLGRVNKSEGFATTVPIRWKEKLPAGQSVVFFARLRSGKLDIRCDAEVPLKKQPSVAGWLPRR